MLAFALADALHAADLVSKSAAAVSIEPDETGAYRVELQGVPASESACFAIAFNELVAPITDPRYLIPRHLSINGTIRNGLRLVVGKPAANAVVYHAVPTVLGDHRKRADALAAAWSRWVSAADAVYTSDPDGAGILAAHVGTDPVDATTTLRQAWT